MWARNLDGYRHLTLVTHCWGIDRRKTEIQEHDRMLWISMCFSLAGGAQNNFMVPSRPSYGCLVQAKEVESPLSLKLKGVHQEKASILMMLLSLLLYPTLPLARHSLSPSSPVSMGRLIDTGGHLVDPCGILSPNLVPCSPVRKLFYTLLCLSCLG